MLNEAVLRLIHQIYDAADGTESWTVPLGGLRSLMRARMTSILSHGPAPGADRVRAAVGLDPTYRQSYESYFCRRNIYTQRGGRLLTRAGSVASQDAYCSNAEILRSEYYNDFQRHLGLFHVLAGVTAVREGATTLVTVNRGRHDIPFSDEERTLLHWFVPHFSRALVMNQCGALADDSAIAFALTPAEARFAGLLVAGRSIAEICGDLGIRLTTARTHLRHLFQKTQTRRQAELVTRLLRPASPAR